MLSSEQIPQPKGGLRKTLSPGNHRVRIYDIQLVDGYNPGSKKLQISVESEPITDGEFEGFFIDKNNPSKGRHLGQVARVNYQRYAFENGVTKGGYVKDRNLDIVRALKQLAEATNKEEALKAIVSNNDDKDLELAYYVEQAKSVLVDKNVYLDVCLCGREYVNKAGYTDVELFFAPYERGKVAFELAGKNSKKLIQFNENNDKHLVKPKQGKPVESFDANEFEV